MKTSQGFTLIEMMIVVCIIGIFIAVIAPQFTGHRQSEEVFDEAHRHLRNLTYTVQGLTCATLDTDNDGYVSCTAKIEGLDRPYAFECMPGNGCRAPKPSTYR